MLLVRIESLNDFCRVYQLVLVGLLVNLGRSNYLQVKYCQRQFIAAFATFSTGCAKSEVRREGKIPMREREPFVR